MALVCRTRVLELGCFTWLQVLSAGSLLFCNRSLQVNDGTSQAQIKQMTKIIQIDMLQRRESSLRNSHDKGCNILMLCVGERRAEFLQVFQLSHGSVFGFGDAATLAHPTYSIEVRLVGLSCASQQRCPNSARVDVNGLIPSCLL